MPSSEQAGHFGRSNVLSLMKRLGDPNLTETAGAAIVSISTIVQRYSEFKVAIFLLGTFPVSI